MKNLIILLALSFTTLISAQNLDQRTINMVKAKYEIAKGHYEGKEYTEALEKLDEVDALLKGNTLPTALNLRIKSLVGLGKYNDAKSLLNQLYVMELSSEIIQDVTSYESEIEDGIKEENERIERERLAKQREVDRQNELNRQAEEKRNYLKSRAAQVITKRYGNPNNGYWFMNDGEIVNIRRKGYSKPTQYWKCYLVDKNYKKKLNETFVSYYKGDDGSCDLSRISKRHPHIVVARSDKDLVGIIDAQSGKIIYPFRLDAVSFSTSDNDDIVLASIPNPNGRDSNSLYGLLNFRTGKWVREPQWSRAYSAGENYFRVGNCKKGSFTYKSKCAQVSFAYITRDGSFITGYDFADDLGDGHYDFSEGLAVVKTFTKSDKRTDGYYWRPSKYGYINTEGTLVIDYQFDRAYRFENGLAKVEKGRKTFYIDKKGNKVKNAQ